MEREKSKQYSLKKVNKISIKEMRLKTIYCNLNVESENYCTYIVGIMSFGVNGCRVSNGQQLNNKEIYRSVKQLLE